MGSRPQVLRMPSDLGMVLPVTDSVLVPHKSNTLGVYPDLPFSSRTDPVCTRSETFDSPLWAVAHTYVTSQYL